MDDLGMDAFPRYEDDGDEAEAMAERACWHCDALGHGYVIGWEDVPGKGSQPILSSPCSYLEPYRYDPRDDEPF